MSVESYMHKAAKAVVAGWFREVAEQAGYDNYANCLGRWWRVNRRGPGWGVWEEYPVLADGFGLEQVWDETDCKHPGYEYLKSIGTPPRVILDVAIQHKGMVILGIEIVHRHDISASKIEFLRESPLQDLYRVPAKWVLSQVKRPLLIPAQFVVWGNEPVLA